MPASTRRWQAGTRTRAPSSSTTHTRQAFCGIRVWPQQSVGVSMPRRSHAARMVVSGATRTSWPSIVSATESLIVVGAARSPDWTMLAAVCPSPQMEASRIAMATSPRSPDTSSPFASLARSSTCRCVPIRQGTHWPQDSWAKNSAPRRMTSRTSAVSSRTTIAPDPTVAPRGRRPSALSGRSRSAGAQHGRRRAAALDRVQPVARPHAAGQVDQAAERRPGGDLVDAGRPTWPDTAKSLVPGESAVPSRAERVGALGQDHGHARERLDVVDHGGPAEETMVDREGGLGARLAPLSLDRVEERGLLAADVGARASPQLEREPRRRSPAPRSSRPARSTSRMAWQEPVVPMAVLAAYVDEDPLRPAGVGGDGRALEDRIGVPLDEDPILERAGLRLVGVDHHVVGL